MRFSAVIMMFSAFAVTACSPDREDQKQAPAAAEASQKSLERSVQTAREGSSYDMGKNVAMLHAQSGTWQVFPQDGSYPPRIGRKDGDMAQVVRMDFPDGYTSNIFSLKCEPAPLFKAVDTRSTSADVQAVVKGSDPDLRDYSLVEVARQLCSDERDLRTEEGTPAKVIQSLRSEILAARPPEGY